jgi:hypothetical protein
MRAISNHCCRCIIQRMIAPLTPEYASSGIAKRPFKKKMAPFKGPFVFTWLVGSHAVVMMMMVMMVMHFPSLCARDRGHRERHGGEGGQHESKLLHRNLSLGWILLVRGR